MAYLPSSIFGLVSITLVLYQRALHVFAIHICVNNLSKKILNSSNYIYDRFPLIEQGCLNKFYAWFSDIPPPLKLSIKS